MIKYAIALAVLIVLAVFAWWAFLPARYLPGNRVRSLQVRLHLRLHPGKGFATILGLGGVLNHPGDDPYKDYVVPDDLIW